MIKYVLIADDEPSWVELLTRRLHRDCVVTEAASAAEVTDAVRHGFDGVVVIDEALADRGVTGFTGQLRHLNPSLQTVLLGAATPGPPRPGVRVVARGDGLDEVVAAVAEAFAERELAAPPASAAIVDARARFGRILTRSERMRRVFEVLGQVVDSRVTVLLQGESGTGKELVARALHHEGARRAAPFVTVNCAGIPDALLESELFGHERGAFTGAVSARKGKFEQADGGTLFLDEIGEMPLHLQAKLLRVLQDRQIERVGASAPRPVDVRIISATHRDLAAMVQTRGFREDLFYRLAVFPVALPPLRERDGDVALLARHFLARCCAEEGKGPLALSSEALALLERHAFPGNVRELENIISRAVLIAETDQIRPEDLPDDLGGRSVALRPAVPAPPAPATARATAATQDLVSALEGLYPTLASIPPLEVVEAALLKHALALARGHMGRAASAVGLSRATLYRRLRQPNAAEREAASAPGDELDP